MASTDKLFAGSIPQLYEQFLVPLIFASYARDLAERVARFEPRDVLEIATGTGIVTRALAACLPAQARIVATDLNQPMLDHAAAQLPQETRITWRQADAQALPMADRSFDAVVCQFGVMFFPDKVQAFREARRVLRPGGRYIFSTWDQISENEFADVVTQALAELFPENPPRFLARTPHGHHDVEKIRRDVESAGFTRVTIDAIDDISRASSPRDPAIAYCQGTPLRNEIDPARLSEATDRAADALANRFGTGAIEGRIRAYAITASA